MIATQTIEKIKETAQVEEVVGEFISLKKRGVNLIGLCPFHDEKTPSFTVTPRINIYKCFGCGAGGDSIKFLMEHAHFTYPEALRYLAEKYNIPIEESNIDDGKDKEDREQKDSLYIVNAFAQKYFTETLFDHEEGRSVGLTYFRERGFSEEIIKKFQLGYALDMPDAFSQTALKTGYKEEKLIKAGLSSKKGPRLTDFFRGRVQFAIHNQIGKVVGFGGRTLKSDKKIPKYINTPESDIYHKSKILYGLYFAKNSIQKEDCCLLVEGYTDVISLSQAGIENVVASSGTSLTTEQIKLISRRSNNITILYDGDTAGVKAALRGIDLILEANMNVKVVMLPDGHDPDSFIKEKGTTEFKSFIQSQAKDFILFKTEYLMQDIKNDPVKRAEAIRDVVATIALVPDLIKREEYIKDCGTYLNTDVRILTTEANKLRKRKFAKEKWVPYHEVEQAQPNEPAIHDQRMVDPEQGIALQERDIIRLLLEYGTLEVDEGASAAEAILGPLGEVIFEKEAYNKILAEFNFGINNNQLPDQKHFLQHPNEEISSLAIDLLHSPYEISENWAEMHHITITDKKYMFKKDIKSSFCRFMLRKLMARIDEIQQIIKQTDDHNETKRLQKKMLHLLEKKKQLAKDLGTVVIR